MKSYLEISPRGFANETYIVFGPPTAIEAASSIINDDVSAWAIRRRADSPEVRAAKRKAERGGYNDAIEALCEAHVRGHRPIYLRNDGSRSLGREPLPL